MFSTRWGVIKISQSLNSVMAADVRRSSLSSLRNEDQVEVRLPLTTLWVVLRNQLLIARRPHPNVDVGWPAPVGDGHVALKAIPSPLSPANTVARCASSYSPLGLVSQNSTLALGIGLHSSAARTAPEST